MRHWRNYQHTHFQQVIDNTLTRVAEYVLSGGQRGVGRVMFFMPPRHGKTTTISKMFPAWILSAAPYLRLIATSYGSKLASRNSRFVRNLIVSPSYQQQFPGVRLAEDTAAVDEWDIAQHGGGMIAAGIGAGITGHGGNIIIIDDPVKSRAEAESETYRQHGMDWYNDDLLTRLEEPGGAILLMMTRWHTADLAGYLLNDDFENWIVVDFPAIAEENDALGREPGEVLWAERYPVLQ